MSINTTFDRQDREVAYYTRFLPIINCEEAGTSYELHGRLDRALKQYEKALALREEIEPKTIEVATLQGRIARLYNRLQNPAQANLHECQKADIVEPLAAAYCAAGEAYYQGRQYKNALIEWQLALDIQTKFAPFEIKTMQLLRRMAQAHEFLGNLKQAAFYLTKGLEVGQRLCPNSKYCANIHGFLASVYNRLDDADYNPHLVIAHLEEQLKIQNILHSCSEDIAKTHDNLVQAYGLLVGEQAIEKARSHRAAIENFKTKMIDKPLPTETAPSSQQKDSISESLSASQAALLLGQTS
jgi:tetratricopeptide (TPR) repeat protein